MAHKHRTPGPWQGRFNEAGQIDIVAGDKVLCTLADDNRDNARLMSAAPELYEAIMAALKALTPIGDVPEDHWTKKAQAAIHKVRCG